MTINWPWSGATSMILPHKVKMIMREVRDQPKPTREQLVNYLKAVDHIHQEHHW